MNYLDLFRLIQKDKPAAFREIGMALNEAPDDFRLIALYATLFQQDDNWGLARILWQKVIQLDKQPEAAAFNNLGLCELSISKQEYIDQGERHLKRSLELDKDNVPAINNLALHALHQGDYERCLRYCERSLALKEDQPEVYETRAYANLILGNFEQGWKDWDWSIGSKYRPNIGTEPAWKGEKGLKLLLRGEQGLGDEISFASVLPDAARDNKITLECDHRLEGLFTRSFPGVDVYGTRVKEQRGNFPRHDAKALIGSLCRHYRNKVEDFPGTPYLVADPERRIQWRALLDTLPGKKIGIAWTGGRTNSFAERRSFKLEQWLPILKTPNTFISLQYKDPTDELQALKEKEGIEVRHWPRASQSNDYDDTAAIVAELDLVITATTAVAHLCGALGKPCWVLVPRKPRWFYCKEGKTLPWYKSVELFRQTKDGWPIQEVADRLGVL